MLKQIDVISSKQSVGVIQTFEVRANNKLIGEIDVMKSGTVYATACRIHENIKQAERWLTLV